MRRLIYPFHLLRKLRLGARLRVLEHDAIVLQAQMITAPLQLAELRAQITDTQIELERLK
jgi:hypothetical protein